MKEKKNNDVQNKTKTITKQNCSKVNVQKEASFRGELHSQQLLAIRPQNRLD